ncbi:MAG: 1,4-dihydroxy-2-naphthoate octaprenyltransferase [Dysgonamonadaceae bacterium]|jgi:1,4-dihydroxy-2-naphthoate octaprenyltransferase|nr:1,4-dihydroxy-2-naphthoate octaprenyltransferase [Dysgonamonadaceae bacterium]
MSKLKYYIKSLRLRTLPLSISGILAGSFLAYSSGHFNIGIFVLAMFTTVFLQILSNVSNEYGDAQNGADNAGRVGPIRSLQSGVLSLKDFRKMIILFVSLSMISGALLVWFSFDTFFCLEGLIMLFLGALAIVAAIKYTVGENNYGYKGLGDIAVFIFFGLASTAGVYFLATHSIELAIFLPASGIGLLSVGVLNVNNIRDRQNDKASGKNTLVVKIGEKKAKLYHFSLVVVAWLCFICYSIFHANNLWNWMYLLILPLFVTHLLAIFRFSGHKLDVQLRNLSLMTLLLSILFGISQII